MITKNGWTVDTDDSSDLLEGETAPAEGLAEGTHNIRNLIAAATDNNAAIGAAISSDANYNNAAYDDGTAENGNISWTGFLSNNVWTKFGDNGALNVKVKGNCEIEWETSGTASNFTVEDSTGKKWVDNGSGTGKFKFFCNAGETTLKITAAKNVYIRNFTIAYSDTPYANGVGSVTIDGATAISADGTAQLTATPTIKYINTGDGAYTIPSSITWNSSDTSAATVTVDSSNNKNATITGVAAGTTKVTATCGGVTSAEKEITVAAAGAGAEGTYVWDFTKLTTLNLVNPTAPNNTVSKSSGTGIANVVLTVSGAKLAYNGQNSAQFNKDTTISVPVNKGDSIEVVAFNGFQSNISIDNTAMATQTVTKTFSEDGTCEIKATANAYILSITLTKVAASN